MAGRDRRKLAWVKFFAENRITSIAGTTKHAHNIIQYIHSNITISNTFIQTSQYPTHSFKHHNIHHIHTQHDIHRQDHVHTSPKQTNVDIDT
jgi:hypothetical protein